MNGLAKRLLILIKCNAVADVLSDTMLSPTSSLKRQAARERHRTLSAHHAGSGDQVDSGIHMPTDRIKRVSSSSSISSLGTLHFLTFLRKHQITLKVVHPLVGNSL